MKQSIKHIAKGTAGDDQSSRCTLFWMDDGDNGCFSNWFRSPFTLCGQEYFCIEQYMMAEKARLFGDFSTMEKILCSNDQAECKALGRKVSPFDSKTWESASYWVVKTASRAKYEQNPALKQALLNTGSSILAEASPYDRIWGIGLNASDALKVPCEKWPGENRLGRILTELRAEFRDQPE